MITWDESKRRKVLRNYGIDIAKIAAAYRSREKDDAVIEEWDAARELGLAR